MSYQIPDLPADTSQSKHASLVIKKSEFIACAYHVTSREAVNLHMKALRARYPDARHHCMGYIIGDPDNTTSAGFDDDGEPGGTAGKPILNVLQHKKIGNCAIIVVRYFGGIKLGAGGLTRAYAQAASTVIDELSLTQHVPMTDASICCGFANEAQVRHLLAKHAAQITNTNYSQQVTLKVKLPTQGVDNLKQDFGGMAVSFTAK